LVVTVVAGLLAAVTLGLPVLCVVALVLWARQLETRGARRFVTRVAYVSTALVAFLTLWGYVASVILAARAFGDRTESSQKARALAEGISEAMNCEALALLVALVAAAWLGFWRWRLRRR
jgi:hypothetical protein